MRGSDILGSLILAFGLGVICGILFSPRSGEETRKILVERMEDNCEKMCDFVTDVGARVRNQVQGYMEELKKDVEESK